MSIYSGSTEIKNVVLGPSHASMQGPCASGFHVPSKNESENLFTIVNNWGFSVDDFCTYLKIPLAGQRNANSTYFSGTIGNYWTSTARDTTYGYRYSWNIRYGIGITGNATAQNGFSIRPFSNTAIVPDNTRTVLYQGTGNSGIFHDTINGLISISDDGINRITISDKNLGATQVWNYGDALSESNCGKFYQWGNNYGFPYSGTVTSSTTSVDASSYGPGNYYSSSTFISLGLWDNSQNLNLWGGQYTPVKGVYVGTTKVRPEYKGPELCFTANTAGSTVKLVKNGTPTSITIQTSTDGDNWSNYTFGSAITLSKVGDKVWFRNASTTTTGFSGTGGNNYHFTLTGSIAASGDLMYILNKNGTTDLTPAGQYCFYRLFQGETALTSAPKLSATTLTTACYYQMFMNCTNLETLVNLPALTLTQQCYYGLFGQCPKIKVSATQTGEYQTPYRIPTTGTGTAGTQSTNTMISGTGGTQTGTPAVNTTYYTSNTLVG